MPSRFEPELPPSTRRVKGPGGLPLLRVDGPTGSGEVFLHGAHVRSWIPSGERPVLWMSRTSRFAPATPIRGGVPICFPWFGPHATNPEAALHGFARLTDWNLRCVEDRGDSVSIQLELTDDEQTRSSEWPYRFRADFTVTFGIDLELELDVVNLDEVEFGFEAAFHNYYEVGDLHRTKVSGLEGREFVSDLESGRERAPVKLSGPISRRYLAADRGRIEDVANGRAITISATGSTSVVLWNPGAEIARTMEDFSEGDWPHMVCFETGNIGESRITLAPGEHHAMRATVSIARL